MLEKQSRLDAEWKACTPKGKLTAHQFLPVFQELVRELEQAGLAKLETELFLEYLRRVCQHWRKSILQHKMMAPECLNDCPNLKAFVERYFICNHTIVVV